MKGFEDLNRVKEFHIWSSRIKPVKQGFVWRVGCSKSREWDAPKSREWMQYDFWC